MAENETVSPKPDKRLRNLRPFVKGDPKNVELGKRGGRPRRPDWVAALADYAAQPEQLKALLKVMLKKHPVDAMHYLAGKPVERIDLSGELKHSVDPNLVAAAQVAIKQL